MYDRSFSQVSPFLEYLLSFPHCELGIHENVSYTAAMRKLMRTSIAVLALSTNFVALAQAPSWINYQGKLTNASGASLADGTYSVTFRVYGAPTGGSAVWTETKSIQIKKGVFATSLGLPTTEGGTPFGAGLFAQRRWLGVTVGSGAEMVPRQELSAVPYALGVPAGSIGAINLQDNSVTANILAQDAGSLGKMTGGMVTAGGGLFATSANTHSFSLVPNGGGRLVLANNTNDNQVWVEFFNSAGNNHATAANITGYLGGTMPLLNVKAAESSFGGKLYLNTNGFGGNASIDLAIGDTDTGFDSQGDGTFWMYANNVKTATIAQNYFQVHGTFVNSSSARYKKNIVGLSSALQTVKRLRPVSYNWKSILDGKKDIGFVAEEVARVLPEITAKNETGEVEGIDYTRFSAILVKAMQEQEVRHEAEKRSLAKKLATMESRLAKLERGR